MFVFTICHAYIDIVAHFDFVTLIPLELYLIGTVRKIEFGSSDILKVIEVKSRIMKIW